MQTFSFTEHCHGIVHGILRSVFAFVKQKFSGLWFRLAINLSLVPETPKIKMGPLIRVIHVGTQRL